MKKFAFILTVSIAVFTVVSCSSGGGGGGGSGTPVDPTPGGTVTKKFWAQNMVTKKFYQLDAQKLAENSRCEVWVEKGSGVTAATANNMANAYNTVYTRVMKTFGYTIDVQIGSSIKEMNTMELAHYLVTGRTSGAKLTLLLLDIKDSYTSGNGAYTAGYFFSGDMFPDDDPDKYRSNELDMIYIDTYPSTPGSQDSNETLAHEMQHLMNFVTSLVFLMDNTRTAVMDTWINEGLSAAAEWVYSQNISDSRLAHYNTDLYGTGTIKEGNNFFVWDNELEDYATVYLFFQYLRLQSANSADIYREILTSSNYSDYRAVITAVDINAAHKNNWSTLLRDWHAANFTNAASGLYGYKNDSKLRNVEAPMFPGGTSTVTLLPGEGVYSKTSSAESVPPVSGSINYSGLGPRGSTSGPNNSTGFVNGARLTYNINTTKDGPQEAGSTTGIAPSIGFSTPGSGSLKTDSSKFSGPFKVDAGYFSRRNGNDSVYDIEKRALNSNNSRSVNGTVKFDTSTMKKVYIDE